MPDVYVYDPDILRHVLTKKYCFKYFIQNNIHSEVKFITDDTTEAKEVFSAVTEQSIFILNCDEYTDELIDSLKQGNPENYIIIVANDFNEILRNMKSGHTPAGFILRPMCQADINKTIGDIISDYTAKNKRCGMAG